MTKLTENFILNADSYKTSHFTFEDEGTTFIKSYGEARTGGEYEETISFGLQYYIIRYLENLRISTSDIDQAEKIITAHGLPFHREGWEYIVRNYEGKLPIRIRAVREGMKIPTGNALYTIENTDSNCAWLVSYMETQLLRAVWYGTTVATRAYHFRKLISKYLKKSGDESLIDFKFIDFGARGVSSKESAEIGGAAHQTSFMGTDNILGMAAIMDYYRENVVPSFSIPASEHTVTILWGKDREKEFFENAVKTHLHEEGDMVSIVSDTYSMENAVKMWGTELKNTILNSGGTVVIRPDSGDPTEQVLKTIQTLDKYFGSSLNNKNFKVLHPSVRVIQGDGITLEKTEEILSTLLSHGYSADNVTFGCGGYLLQDLTRDTLRFAMKGCYAEVNNESRNIAKVVATDPTKASKAGNITLAKRADGSLATITIDEFKDSDVDLLETIYVNGVVMRKQKFSDIRELVKAQQ